MLKTLGYMVSSLSVALLGWVSWDSAKSDPKMLTALLLGMGTSLLGMFLRWLQHRKDSKR